MKKSCDVKKSPINIPFSAPDKERIKRKADEIGISMATYLRMIILKSIDEGGD